MTHNKAFSLAVTGICLALATVSFAGCGNEFTPDASLKYFDNGDAYRVIELQNEEPVQRKAQLLYSLITPVAVTPFLNVPVEDNLDIFGSSNVFFEEYGVLNKCGIELVYDCLNLTAYNLTEDATQCYVSNLYTFRKLDNRYSTHKATYNTGERSGIYVIGYIADLDEYTFAYRDLSKKDGSEIGNGTFTVLVNGTCTLDWFQISD